MLANIYTYAGEFDKAVVHAERGLALDPNSYMVLYNGASALAFSGRVEESIPLFQKALRLNPFPPAMFFSRMSVVYNQAGRFAEAVEQAKKAVERDPKNFTTYLSLAAACILAGREEEGRAAAKEVLKINPMFSVEQFAKTLPFKDKSHVQSAINTLRKAGLK
jgi:tetratricopeptide (TPR) repeat protein